MTSRLFTGEKKIWPVLTKAAKNASRGDVAVAYFGAGGAKRLPLKRGSRLVVDASEATVAAGSTDPKELLKLSLKGIRVYSRPQLHAKVFVFARTAFVGSSNNSKRSSEKLLEAVLQTTEKAAVADARAFVIDACEGLELGKEELGRLSKLYRPPKPPRPPKSVKQAGLRQRKPVVWFAEVPYADYPAGFEDEAKQVMGQAEAARRYDDATHEVDEVWTPGKDPYRVKDTLVMAFRRNGRLMVWPPGRVIHVKEWSNGRAKYTFTYTEHPIKNACGFERMTKSLGRGWKKRLTKGGKLNAEAGMALLQWWDQRGQR